MIDIQDDYNREHSLLNCFDKYNLILIVYSNM